MKSVRMNKVNRTLMVEITDVILKKLKDPRLTKWISVTDVVTSKDLHSAKVYFSTAADDLIAGQHGNLTREERHQEIADVLNSASEIIRQELRERVRMKFIPKLSFAYDETMEYGLKMDRLIDEANDGNKR